jgi:peptide deformylase
MEILNYPQPILRFKTREVKKVDDYIRAAAKELADTMLAEKGLGLAANQVGLPLRMFVVSAEGKPLCLINPVVRPYGKRRTMIEGCLSFPGTGLAISRPSKCHVKGWSLHGDNVDEDVGGMLARVIQHEMDHLDGILFVDRVSETKRASSPLADDLVAYERAWLLNPTQPTWDAFNEILYTHCGVERPVDGDGVGPAAL